MKIKQKKVFVIGSATQDLFLKYPDQKVIDFEIDNEQKKFLIFEQGAKLDIQKINSYSGGGATNIGVGFARLGFNTTIFFKIAKDASGKFILNELKKENIKIKAIYSKDNQTGLSIILPTPCADKTILAYRGVNKEIHENELPIDEIKKNNLLFIAPLSGNSTKILLPLTQFAKQNNILVAVNPSSQQVNDDKINEFKNSLKNIDILILNKKEATELLKSLNKKVEFTIQTYFNLILKSGPSIAVITDGANGVYAANTQKIHFQKSINTKIINTVGAGDSFSSGFVASLLMGKTIEEAAIYGTINASSVIQHEGAKTGLLTWKEIANKKN